MPRTGNKVTPNNKNDVLYTDEDSTGTHIGSAEWFDWLETATTFYYQAAVGTFTAKREKRRGSFYWFAYRRSNSKLHNTYLGKEDALTADHLAEAASQLHIKANTVL